MIMRWRSKDSWFHRRAKGHQALARINLKPNFDYMAIQGHVHYGRSQLDGGPFFCKQTVRIGPDDEIEYRYYGMGQFDSVRAHTGTVYKCLRMRLHPDFLDLGEVNPWFTTTYRIDGNVRVWQLRIVGPHGDPRDRPTRDEEEQRGLVQLW